MMYAISQNITLQFGRDTQFEKSCNVYIKNRSSVSSTQTYMHMGELPRNRPSIRLVSLL